MGLLNPYWYAAGGASPTDVPAMAWWDASDTSTIAHTSDQVTQWDDKSGNANHATKLAGTDVKTNVATHNSLNVLDFTAGRIDANTAASVWKFMHDGSDYHIFMVLQAGKVANPAALYGLMETSSGTGDGMWVAWDDTGSGEYIQHFVHRSTGYSNPTANNLSATGAMLANTMLLLEIDADLDNSTAADRSAIKIDNGTAIKNNTSTQTPGTSNPNHTLHIGTYASPSYDLTGYIAEILIYDAALSASDRDDIVNYLQTKWNITYEIQDPFDGGSGDVPDTATWDEISGALRQTGAGMLQKGSSNGTVDLMVSDDPLSSSDHYCEIYYNAGDFVAPFVRADGTAANGYFGAHYSVSGDWEIYRQTSGSPTKIANTSGTAPSTGDVIRMEANGTTIRVLVNGSQVVTVTDSTHSGSHVGLRTFLTPSSIKELRANAL